MKLSTTLMDIERELWTGSGEAYLSSLDEECLVAFIDRAGVSAPSDVAAAVDESSHRWKDLEFELEGLVRPTDDVALLTYEASAVREGDARYHARVSSGYVRRDGDWKLMFHQQTPLPIR